MADRVLACVAATAIVAAGAAPQPASAQLKPEVQLGSHIPVKPTAVDPVRTGQVRKAFARCLYASRPAKAVEFIAKVDPTATDDSTFSKQAVHRLLPLESCLAKQVGSESRAYSLTFREKQLRVMLQEEVYLAQTKVPPTPGTGSGDLVSASTSAGSDAKPRSDGVAAFADCVVLKDVARSDAVLRTMPGSPAETAATRALASALGGCLVEGNTLSLRPANVRGLVADGLWARYVAK